MAWLEPLATTAAARYGVFVPNPLRENPDP
jgi:hypothetical protein